MFQLEPDARCPACDHDSLLICSQRRRSVQLLDGPALLIAKLAECERQSCPTKGHLISPSTELQIALPKLAIGWDVFAWIGHRRLARDWRVGQIRQELLETYQLKLSDDSIERHIARYEAMLAARERDPARLRRSYRGARGLILTIDGLQPEKGHETLYVVRELTRRRVLFAAPLLSSAASEVAQLLENARDWAEIIGKPVLAWMSDKQDAFVSEIRRLFPGVPHRFCANHFLRDAAKPVLEADAHAKVQMRRKVRGLRAIEREILSASTAVASAPAASTPSGPAAEPLFPIPVAPTAASPVRPPAPSPVPGPPPASPPAPQNTPAGVVLEYCAAVRGILNDDQGGPLRPPGVRMADALGEVRSSIQRLIDAPDPEPSQNRRLLTRLAGCIDRGVSLVEDSLTEVREHAAILAEVEACLDPSSERSVEQRQRSFRRLANTLVDADDPVRVHIGRTMKSFSRGLFVGSDIPGIPADNLDLERAFKLPKHHRRRIHGRAHAGSGLVQSGATLLPALDAHQRHPEIFATADLLPYRNAKPPLCQRQALQRRAIMRKARSTKRRPALLASLETRYLAALASQSGSK